MHNETTTSYRYREENKDFCRGFRIARFLYVKRNVLSESWWLFTPNLASLSIIVWTEESPTTCNRWHRCLPDRHPILWLVVRGEFVQQRQYIPSPLNLWSQDQFPMAFLRSEEFSSSIKDNNMFLKVNYIVLKIFIDPVSTASERHPHVEMSAVVHLPHDIGYRILALLALSSYPSLYRH